MLKTFAVVCSGRDAIIAAAVKTVDGAGNVA